MSESVSGGESYSNSSSSSSSRKYGESPSGESYSPSQPNSYSSSYNQPNKAPLPKAKVEEIKKLLKETEDFLIQFCKESYTLLKEEDIKKSFRAVVLNNEQDILDFPTLETLVNCYQKNYNSLSNGEQNDMKNKFLIDGLTKFSEKKRHEKSPLKYW